jgi:O-antigen/teichoic acid export membrane protein
MALSAKIAFNTGIQVISKIVGTLVSLAVVALITRYLGNYGFGYYTTALTFVTFFSIAGDLGLTLVTTQLISRPGANQARILSNLFAFRVLSAAAILLIAPLIVVFFPYDPIVKQGIAVTALAFFFVLLNQVFVSLFQKELRADRIAVAEVVSRLVMFAATALVLWFDWGLMGILWSMAIANGVSFFIHYYYSRPYAKIGFAFDWSLWSDIMSRAWPLVLTIVLNLVYLKTDTLLLSLLKSPTDVGLYGAAYKVVDVLVAIPFMIGGTILPILSMRWQSGAREDYSRAWQKIFDATSLLVWPAIIGGYVLATPIMAVVAGTDFVGAGPILEILIFAVGGVFFSSFFSYTMISFNSQRKLIGAYLFTALTALVLYLIFIPRFSYIGAAWVTVYSEIAITLGAWWLVRRYGKLTARWNVFFKALLAALAMGALIKFLPIDFQTVSGLSIAIVTGAALYGAIILAIKAISWSEIREMLTGKSRSV